MSEVYSVQLSGVCWPVTPTKLTMSPKKTLTPKTSRTNRAAMT